LPLAGLRRAACVTAPSQFTANRIIEKNNLRRERVSVLPWCLDPDFEQRRLYNRAKFIRPSGKIILTVTRLVASEGYKGVDHVIQAMPSLLRLVPDVTYVIVGDGDDRPRLATLADKLGVAGRVVFAGMRTNEEVALYHSTADLYTMPSRGEGFGIVFLEAMACSKPVVAARAAATPELVRHQETGLLVDYGDVPELTRVLARLLLDTDLSKQMGQKARERVTTDHTFAHFRKRLNNLVEAQIGCREEARRHD
jgi:glycosyltransferase involved in cell wall biosynthesis